MRLAALPRYAISLNTPPPEPLLRLYPVPVREVSLEIGFGGGEHLVKQALAHRDIGFIGCEPFEDGVAKVLRAVEENGLANVLLYPGDARLLLRWLPPGTLAGVFILFPDPWPKKRHQKRRLISEPFAALLAGAMKPGAELRLATDAGDYARQMLLVLSRASGFHWMAEEARSWRERPADWPETRYEEKARAAGRRCYFLRFIRTP